MITMDNEDTIIDVEDENAVDGDNGGNGDNESGDEMTSDDSDVLHGEIVSEEEAAHALATNGDESDAFYAKLGTDVAAELRSAAVDAKHHMLNVRDEAVEAGRVLNRARSLLQHGQFTNWVRIEFGKGTVRTAQNFMSLAIAVDTSLSLFGPEAEAKVLALPQTVAYKIGADNLPDDDRTNILERINSGELADPKEIVEVVNDAKAAENERRGALKEASGKGKSAKGDGDGDEDGETFAEKRKKRADAKRQATAFNLAFAILHIEWEERDGSEFLTADQIISYYEDIGSGPKRKMTVEDHAMVSDMLLRVTQAYKRGGKEAALALRPVIPEEPVSKAAKAKKAKAEGD